MCIATCIHEEAFRWVVAQVALHEAYESAMKALYMPHYTKENWKLWLDRGLLGLCKPNHLQFYRSCS